MSGKMKLIVGLIFFALVAVYACASKQGPTYVFPSAIRLHLPTTIASLHTSIPRCAACAISSDSVMTVMGSGWNRNHQTRTALQLTGVPRTGATT